MSSTRNSHRWLQSVIQFFGCDVTNGREDKAMLGNSHRRDREGAVSGIRWPIIRCRLHHRLVHTSLVWKIHLLLISFINFYVQNTVAIWLLRSWLAKIRQIKFQMNVPIKLIEIVYQQHTEINIFKIAMKCSNGVILLKWYIISYM